MDKTINARQLRKEYKKLHGHFPEDYKSRSECFVCQTKSLVEHAVIANAASSDYDTFVAKTGYSEDVKAAALKELHSR